MQHSGFRVYFGESDHGRFGGELVGDLAASGVDNRFSCRVFRDCSIGREDLLVAAASGFGSQHVPRAEDCEITDHIAPSIGP